jgi:hypothetical protein
MNRGRVGSSVQPPRRDPGGRAEQPDHAHRGDLLRQHGADSEGRQQVDQPVTQQGGAGKEARLGSQAGLRRGAKQAQRQAHGRAALGDIVLQGRKYSLVAPVHLGGQADQENVEVNGDRP